MPYAQPWPDELTDFVRESALQFSDSRLVYALVTWPGMGQDPVIIDALPSGVLQDSVKVTLAWEGRTGRQEFQEVERTLRALVSGANVNAATSLSGHERWGRLIGDPEGMMDFVALPVLQGAPFWEEIRTLPVDEVSRYVQNLSRGEDGTMEVLGFRVGAQVLGWAGPPILLVLLAHLLLHARHLRRICHESPGLVSRYAWIPMFPDRWAQRSAVVTICVLPFLGGALVAWRLIEVSELTAAWAGVMAALSVSVSVRALAALRDVRLSVTAHESSSSAV